MYGLVRTLLRRRLRRASGTGLCGGYALRKFQSTWLTLHPVPIVRPVRQVRHSLLPPCALRNALCQPTEHTALCYRNSKAHGTQAGIDHLQYSRYSQYSWFLCSYPVPCTMCSASRWECAMFFGERTAHGARGETSLFPPCAPLSPRVLYRGLRHAMRLLYG